MHFAVHVCQCGAVKRQWCILLGGQYVYQRELFLECGNIGLLGLQDVDRRQPLGRHMELFVDHSV